MDYFKKIVLVWQKVSVVQRALLMAVAGASLIVGWLLVHWARTPDMRMLYQDLAPAEASKITEKISSQNIPYELRDGGTAVYVPVQHVYQLRLDLAKEGLPAGEQSGYKLFDDEKLGVSPFVQNVNLKRALQDELAKSIQMIDGVAHARVHIVAPEQAVFATEQEQTTASVILQIKPGYRLSGTNIAAITHMVSGSVKGLKPEDVTIIDSEGRLLSGGSDPTMIAAGGTVHDYKERVEQSLAKKAEDMLTTVLGPGRATVRVSAVVDMNSVSTVTETYDPTGKVPTKEEVTSNKETGVGGTAQKTAAGTTKTDETVVTEYQVGKTVKQQVIVPGEIKKLSVAAFVDLSPADPNATGANGQPAEIMPVTDVEQIIRTALGLKEADELKVVNTKFHRSTQAVTEEKESNWPRYLAMARQLSLGIMAVCALVVLRIFRKAHRQAQAQAPAQTPQLAAGAAPERLPPAGGMSAEPVALRRQIVHALRSNPEQVKEMFHSWLEETE
jgi:flagellar M-ring protein FliF